jgi:hypothetical protein
LVHNGVRSTKSNFLNGSAHHHSDFLTLYVCSQRTVENGLPSPRWSNSARHFRFWHKADITIVLSHVRFRG